MSLRLAGILALMGLATCSDSVQWVVFQSDTTGDCRCITPLTATLVVGDVMRFTVSGVHDETWKWTSSDTTRITIDQTGQARAIQAGSANISAQSSLDHHGSVAVTVLSSEPPFLDLVIDAVNEVPAETPANLSDLFGTVEVVFSAPLSPIISSAALVVTRTSGDTTVTTLNPPASGSAWNGAMRWNTADTTAGGVRAFANGTYVLSLAIHTASGTTIRGSRLQVTVANP